MATLSHTAVYERDLICPAINTTTLYINFLYLFSIPSFSLAFLQSDSFKANSKLFNKVEFYFYLTAIPDKQRIWFKVHDQKLYFYISEKKSRIFWMLDTFFGVVVVVRLTNMNHQQTIWIIKLDKQLHLLTSHLFTMQYRASLTMPSDSCDNFQCNDYCLFYQFCVIGETHKST